MKKLFAAAALAALGMGPALAADLPPKAPPPYRPPPPPVVAPYNWTGFYLGANGGWGFGTKCWTFLGSVVGGPVPPVKEGCHDPSGGLVGGQVGANYQINQNWVVGLEAQGDWANLKASNVSVPFPTFTNRTRIDALGLLTGRVGFAWDATLLYVKGGAALAHDKYDYFLTAAPNPPTGTASETRWGYTVGAGVEFGFAQNWSLAVEYDWVDLGKKNVTFASPTQTIDQIREGIHLVTGRINYRFGGPVSARY
jgi:outer membrane immunogenic protein